MSNTTANSSFELILPPGIRLDRFLVAAVQDRGAEFSRSRLQRLIVEGGISGIPAEKLKPSFQSKQACKIIVTLPAETEIVLKPLDIDIPVLYEDAWLAIVHKPAGMTVHPGAGTGDDTMVHALLSRLDKLAPHAERPGIVHRLDRETEGLMIVAKTEKARAALSELFAQRKIHKTYVALVWGRVKLPDEINGFISRDIHNRKKMRFDEMLPENIGRAREALLHITEQQPVKFATRLTLELITGRTHQIRATCAYFNAPVIGDSLYGNDATKYKLFKIGKDNRKRLENAGMLLISQSLSFSHPFRKKKLEFSLPLPERFHEVEQILN